MERTSTISSNRTPPMPALPPAAQALRWITQPYEFLRECSSQFGHVFALDFGAQGKYAIFSAPDAIRAIFNANAGVLRMGSGNAVLQPILGPASLLLLEGEQHVKERRLLLPAFHASAILRYGDVIRDALDAATADWSAGHQFVAQQVLQDVSIDVILRAVFGLRSGPTCAELKRELVSLLNDRRLGLGLLGRLRDAAPHPILVEFQKRFQRVGALTESVIAERRASGAREDDMLSLLLEATDEHGQRRPDDTIRDELLTLVVTGHETTATALSWGLYWISSYSAVQGRLRRELLSAGPVTGPKGYGALEYLDATCKEILRICPIVPAVFREVVKPFEVAGYQFEPGTVLSPSVYLTHHREDIYPNNATFAPERFLKHKYSGYEYFPFGGGARRCIGMPLAVFEMQVILATLVERYEFGLAPGQTIVPVRRVATMAPSGGPRVLVKAALS